MKWNWQMRFSSPRGSIADSPKDNQRKKKERKMELADVFSIHLMVVLETALITSKRKTKKKKERKRKQEKWNWDVYLFYFTSW